MIFDANADDYFKQLFEQQGGKRESRTPMNDEEPKIWERLQGESSKRYYAFCLYRGMGAQERSLSR